MSFHLKGFEVCRTAGLLFEDVLFQLGGGECFVLVAGEEKVGGFHVDDGVYFVSGGYCLAHAGECADAVVVYVPAVGLVCQGVVGDAGCGEVGNEFFVFKTVE